MVEEEITSEPVNVEESLNRIKRGTVFSFSTPESFKNYQYPNYQSFGQPRNQILLQSGYDSSGMQDPKFQQLAQNFIKDYTNNYSPYNRQPTQQRTTKCEQRGNQVKWLNYQLFIKLTGNFSCF